MSSDLHTISRLATTVLWSLLVRKDGRAKREAVAKALWPLVEHRASKAEWARELDAAIDELTAAGYVAPPPPPPEPKPQGKARSRKAPAPKRAAAAPLSLEPAGREAALAALGVTKLPPKTTWAKLLSTFVFPAALGAPPPRSAVAIKRLTGKGGAAAAVVRKTRALALDEHPAAGEAIDALAWKELGVDTPAPFDLKAVVELLLGRALGSSEPVDLGEGRFDIKSVKAFLLGRALGRAEPDPAKALAQLAAKTVASPRPDDALIRVAALREWLSAGFGEEARGTAPTREAAPAEPSREAARAPAAPPPPVGRDERDARARDRDAVAPPPANGDDLGRFARDALDAAGRSRTGRFGDGLVFISHAWRSFASRGDRAATSLNAFKEKLVSAHRAGLLVLTRADLVEVMDPVDVAESETRYLGARFHFVRLADPHLAHAARPHDSA